MTCPMCGRDFHDKRHPKDSSMVAAHVQAVEHIRQYHWDEVLRRLEAKREVSR